MVKAAIFGLLVATAMPALADTPSAKLAADIRIQESRNQAALSDSGDYVELAQAYLRAGRVGDAVFAYRAALKQDKAMILTKTGDAVWSHEIARNALAVTPQLAAR